MIASPPRLAPIPIPASVPEDRLEWGEDKVVGVLTGLGGPEVSFGSRTLWISNISDQKT
jgi:hypothetical protein